MLEKIVVGYASDRAGRDALALAAQIAAASGGGVTVVFPYRPALTRETSEQAQARVETEVRGQLDAIRASEAIGSPAYRWSPSSWPIRALHELAAYENADLMVMGAAREDLGDRLHVGLMERMVHGAPCAVAVAPAGYAESLGTPPQKAAAPTEAEDVGIEPAGAPNGVRSRLRRIGVGFSRTSEGRAAVTLALELAALVGAGVNVIAGAGLEPALASYSFSSPALGEVEEEIYAETEQTLTRVCEELGAGDGVDIEHETVRGDPASVLVERSAELDLLVLGSRAYGPLRHVLLGSVSARAMREAKCPVLVVPRGVAGEDGHADEQPAGVARHA
ncbi:MAG TPA: universal stress protein [Solirubrobacteraceae bacterium]|jgi:nucleotide-binding universal stress UspA family protein